MIHPQRLLGNNFEDDRANAALLSASKDGILGDRVAAQYQAANTIQSGRYVLPRSREDRLPPPSCQRKLASRAAGDQLAAGDPSVRWGDVLPWTTISD